MKTPYYEDEYVTLYCGDCRDIVPHLGRFDLLLTDPPYGLGDKFQGGTWKASKKIEDMRKWDSEVPCLDFLLDLKIPSIIWGGNYFDLPPCRCVLAWRKLNAVSTMSDFEMAWTNFDMPAKMFSHCSSGAMKTHGHPTQKPVALMSWCITLAGDGIQTILDPFAGSGTTGVAAKLLNRKCTLIEKEERYCEIAARRLGQGVLPLFEVKEQGNGQD